MRLKLTENYNFDLHNDASRLRDNITLEQIQVIIFMHIRWLLVANLRILHCNDDSASLVSYTFVSNHTIS